jgi:ubiquinone biosynthesis monooxygenase Coq7
MAQIPTQSPPPGDPTKHPLYKVTNPPRWAVEAALGQASFRGRELSPFDRLIGGVDQAIRTVSGVHASSRPYPAEGIADSLTEPVDRRHVAGLMRVNHSGEVAAQALYAGQALTARRAATQSSMIAAAQEESDHLAWCSERINELGGRKSFLNPLWYAGSFAIGALAGLSGDKTSLGFVAETEKQVGKHLDSHLRQLPMGDTRSRAILEKMSDDEARHGQHASEAGGRDLPPPIRALMSFTSKIMTRTAYWL